MFTRLLWLCIVGVYMFGECACVLNDTSGYSLFIKTKNETLGPWGPSARKLYEELAARVVEASRDQKADSEYDRLPRLFTLDEYAPCLRRGSAYCVGRFDLYADGPNDLLTRIHEHSANTKKHYNHTYVEKGVCLSECEEADVQASAVSDADALERCVDARMRRQHGLRASLAALYYCERRDDKRAPDQLDWAVASLLLAILVANVLGTLYDVVFVKDPNDATGFKSYLICFSVRRSWASLFHQPDDPRFRSTGALHGIKCISSFFVVKAHVFFLIALGFTDNPQDFEKGYDTTYFQFFFNAMSIVQVFFVISGFVMVYNFKIYSETNDVTWSMLPKAFFYRWWRLTPVNGVMLALSATWLPHFGSGPLWNLYVTNSVTNDCRKYWWAHLLYIENYVEDDKYCNLHAWHLSADVQAFVVGLVVCIATKRRGRNLALALLLLVAMVAPALHVLQGMDPLVLLTPETYRAMGNDTLRYVHTSGHVNLASFVVGMATGYLVYDLQQRKVNLKKYDKIITVLCWCVIPVMLLCFIVGRVFYEDDVEISVPMRMFFASTHRVAVALLVAFAIVAMAMDCAKSFISILSWKGWILFSKLSYGVYILHMNIVHMILGSKTQLGHVSLFYFWITHMGVLSLSLALAVPCYLLLESPMNRLARTLLTGRAHAQRTQSKKIS